MPKKSVNYPIPKPKVISVRDFFHNMSYYFEHANQQPVMITNRGQAQVMLVEPTYFEKKKKPVKRDITKLAFFTEYKESPERKGKSSAEIADELRRKAWSRDE